MTHEHEKCMRAETRHDPVSMNVLCSFEAPQSEHYECFNWGESANAVPILLLIFFFFLDTSLKSPAVQNK